MQRREDVLYITLVDFLLQLLFLGMVMSVVYLLAKQEYEVKVIERAKSAVDEIEQVKRLAGISNLRELTDNLTRLGPISQVSKDADAWRTISKEVGAVGGVKVARKILAEQSIKLAGEGLPSCLPNKERLATFSAYGDHIELESYNPAFTNVLSTLGLSIENVQSLSLIEFTNRFSPISKVFPNCRYSISLIEHTYDTRPRDAVKVAFGRTFPKHATNIK